MNKLIHLTDFSLQSGVEYDKADNPRYGLNGWRLYNQHRNAEIMADQEREGKDSVLRFISSSEAPLRPGIIIYKVISGFPIGYKLKFSMTARRIGSNNQPELSFYYGSTLLKDSFHLTDEYEEYFGDFTVCDEVTILAIENSTTQSSGNDFYLSELKIQPQDVV